MNRETIKNLLQIVGMAGLMGNTIVLAIIIYFAYFNNYLILIAINQSGEAHFDALFILFTLITGIYVTYHVMKELMQNEN